MSDECWIVEDSKVNFSLSWGIISGLNFRSVWWILISDYNEPSLDVLYFLPYFFNISILVHDFEFHGE
jgi:hypothetical protein